MGKILIIADEYNKPQVAVERGLTLAQATGEQVDIVGFCYEPLKVAGKTLSESLKQRAIDRALKKRKEILNKYLLNRASKARHISVNAVWEKHIHRWVTKTCQLADYEMVIKSGHRSEQLFYTPTDWHLLRECPAPVMIVSDKKWRRTKPILAALDLSTTRKSKQKLNDAILNAAIALAEQMNKEVFVIHALEVSQVLSDLDVIDVRKLTATRRKKLKASVAQLAQSSGI